MMGGPGAARRFWLGVPDGTRRLWEGLLQRHRLGYIVIKFYPRGGEASITTAPALAVLSRHEWHWLYLQHLAGTLGALVEEDAARLLAAARARAEEFVSSSYWPHVIGEKIPVAVRGAVEIVPEEPGGTALRAEIVRHGRGMPSVRLPRVPPRARTRLESSNLVLLDHVMKRATHPLEQYELFKKIMLFAEYCERADRWHDRATLNDGPLYAVVHADLASVRTPAGRLEQRARGALGAVGSGRHQGFPCGADRPARPPRRPVLRSLFRAPRPGRPLWQRSGASVLAAAVAWAGLILSAVLVSHNGGGPPSRTTGTGVSPAVRQPQAAAPLGVPGKPPSGQRAPRDLPEVTAVRTPGLRSGGSGEGRNVRRSVPRPDAEQGDFPRFRVVSGILARDVAEFRAKALAGQGIGSSVRVTTGTLARIQYGAYRSREVAEADARHLRAQGYTAEVVGW